MTKKVEQANSHKQIVLERKKYELNNDTIHKNIVSLKGGIVIFKGNKEGYNNTIIVQGSDGFDIWYGNLENINVNIYDYIDEGSIVGNCLENLYLVITKDNKYYTYEEYENISKN